VTKFLRIEREDNLAWLVIDRPDKRNALNYEMWMALPELAAELEADPAVRVVILRGVDDSAFSAGADISEFETLRANSEGARTYNAATHAGERAIAELRKPTVAMVQGPCIGGGCGLALACDFRFSDENGRFGITPAKLGMVYSLTATKQLVDVVGPSHAKYILFSGLQLDAERAYQIGLVNELVPTAEIVGRTRRFASIVASRAQYAVRGTKRVVELILDGESEDNEETKSLRNDAFDTEDYQEGVRAFLEKRKPVFTYS
jgi:enoyl-CoA hydratase